MRTRPLFGDPRAAVERVQGYDPDSLGSCVECALSGTTKRAGMRGQHGGAGGVLVLVDQPTKDEDTAGRGFVSRTHMGLLHSIRQLYKGPIHADYAVHCAGGKDVTSTHVERCRGHLATLLAEIQPTRVICAGTNAYESVFGRRVANSQARKAYGWLTNASWAPPVAVPDDGGGPDRIFRPVPVFAVAAPGSTLYNAWLGRWLKEDLKWALEAQPALPPWGAVVRVVEDAADAAQAMADCYQARTVVVDVETSGVMHNGQRIVCLAVSLVGGDLPRRTWLWQEDALRDPARLGPLAKVLGDPSVPKAGQHVKYDFQAIRQALKIDVQHLAGDTRLWRRLLESDAPADLETMQELIGMGGGKDEIAPLIEAEVLKLRKAAQACKNQVAKLNPAVATALKGRKEQVTLLLEEHRHVLTADQVQVLQQGDNPRAYAYGYVDPDTLGRYCAMDTLSTAVLIDHLEPQLVTEDLMFVWDELWGPASEALVQVETWGFPVDVQAMRTLSSYLGAQMAMISSRFAQYPDFLPDSHQSVAKLLFQTLKLKPTHLTPGGDPSTAREALDALRGQHPIVDDLIAWRGYAKLKSQYADGLMYHVAADGRVHTTYNVDGARSGRASSENPNMQNIPNEEKGADAKLVKDCFVSEPGWTLLAADYKQLEFRVGADLSDDKAMQSIFLNGIDFHTATAQFIAPIVWGVTPCPSCTKDHCHVTKRHRGGAKAFNFGVMYGMTDGGIASRANCSLQEAGQIRAAIMGKFNRFAAWIYEQLTAARKTGYAYTYWAGRKAHRRQLWKIADEDKASKNNAENSAHNTPVQGTSSYYTLASVTALVNLIKRKQLPIQVVATVHDSIVLMVRDDYVPQAARLLRQVMCGWGTMTGVPLDIDMKAGTRWGSLIDYVEPEVRAAYLLGGHAAAQEALAGLGDN